MPPIFPLYDEYTEISTSYIQIQLKSDENGDERDETRYMHLDTSAAGFGHYEDARIIKISEDLVAIVCTKYLLKVARICVFVFDPFKGLTLGSVEFFCKSQSQKNWMPQMMGSSLLLWSSLEHSTIHEIPNICDVRNHHMTFIGPCKIGRWRGSSAILETPYGTLGMVHRRTKENFTNWIVKERFLPHYEHSFVLLKTNGQVIEKTYSAPFTVKIEGFDGFVYISGFDVVEDSLEICAGVTDCYAVKFVMTPEMIRGLFDNKSSIFTVQPSEVL
jgi:hypothetical protein